MYCLDCAKRGTKGEPLDGADAMTVLRALRTLGDGGDLAARRFYFGILWDEGRSILCYRCKRARPVRLTDQEIAELDGTVSPNVAPTTPSSPVGEKTAEGGESPEQQQQRRAA